MAEKISGFAELDAVVHKDFKNEMRLMSILLSFGVMSNFVDPAIFILLETRSVIGTVAALSSSAKVIASAFLLMAALVLPFLFMQVFVPRIKCRKFIIRLTCFAMCVGGVLWIYLAFLSRNLDFGGATFVFVKSGLGAIAMGGVLALTINNKQRREQQEFR
jgi:hypothetical protein